MHHEHSCRFMIHTVAAWPISACYPPHMPACWRQVLDIQSDAQFILLVEKDAAFMRLAEDRFYNTYPCIILTAKGQPDVATRCGSPPSCCALVQHIPNLHLHHV